MSSKPNSPDIAGTHLLPSNPNKGRHDGGFGDSGGIKKKSSTHGSVRTRPCDTCRIRKTKCVLPQDQTRCVLCTFHDQPCTFLRGPTVRKRQPRPGSEDGRNSAIDINIDSVIEGLADDTGLDWLMATGDASNIAVNNISPTELAQDTSSEIESPDRVQPEILRNTLGLDPNTHADYVGFTDYRYPVAFELQQSHQNHQVGTDTQSLSVKTRQLDSRFLFFVHSDEASASETQRIADLDAIEATVSPLGRTLVDLYFRIVHPSFPILHKDVFVSKHRISHHQFAPSLLAAVYLLALDWHLYDSSLAGSDRSSMPDHSALEALAERTIVEDMRRPKLSTLEAGLLLLQRRYRVEEPGPRLNQYQISTRIFTAQLITIAQDMGIHLDCSFWSIPHWEIGLRRRLAWALYMQDRWGSCIHGRPVLINESDWAVQLCSGMDYPELQEHGDTDIANMHTPTSVGWEVFLRNVELAQILSRVLTTFYSASACCEGGSLDQLGIVGVVELAKPIIIQLRQWHSSLSQRLRLETIRFRELCATGALHLAHAATEIILHRALIRAMGPETPESLQKALWSTARTKVHSAIELLNSLRPEHTAAFWGSAAAYQAAQIASLAALLWTKAESQEDLEWCRARMEDVRWALRVRGAAVPFARDALRLVERAFSSVGNVNASSMRF